MSFQWLWTRISEEQDRRQREASILERLPLMLDEVHAAVLLCAETYNEAFGGGMEVHFEPPRIEVRERAAGTAVSVTAVPELPGLRIDRNGQIKEIVVGVLNGDKTFFKDDEQFLTMDELTRRILDRTLFPKLGD